MADDKPKPTQPSGKPETSTDNASKGEFGGLTSLGPGGGRDIEEALDSDDIDPEDTETPKP